MQRLPFVMKVAPRRRAEVIAALRGSWGEIDAALRRAGAENFSVWSIQDFLFCYGEYPDGVCPPAACGERWAAATADCEMFAAPGTLPLMYHDIGVVRKDKSLMNNTDVSFFISYHFAISHSSVITVEKYSLTLLEKSRVPSHRCLIFKVQSLFAYS